MEAPIFKKRISNGKYQARFWTTEEKWKAFGNACESNGLVIQDVSNELLDWFIERALQQKLEIVEGNND